MITCRPSALSQPWQQAADLARAVVDWLTAPQRQTLVNRWFEAWQRRSGVALDPSLAEGLNGRINAAPALGRLAMNPLLAAMLCALKASGGGNVRGRLNSVVRDVIDMLLNRRSDARSVGIAGGSS